MYNAQTLKHKQHDVKLMEEVVLVQLCDVYMFFVTVL